MSFQVEACGDGNRRLATLNRGFRRSQSMSGGSENTDL